MISSLKLEGSDHVVYWLCISHYLANILNKYLQTMNIKHYQANEQLL